MRSIKGLFSAVTAALAGGYHLNMTPAFRPRSWGGLVRPSVARQDHIGACNFRKPHQGARERARRRRQRGLE